MGTEKRNQNSETADLKNRPGPGQYLTKSFVGEGPKIGIKARGPEKELSKSIAPGPGAYQPKLDAIIQKPPAVGLGKGSRDGAFNSKAAAVPGPGAYASEIKKEGPKFGFGTSKRNEAKPSAVPGPGNYAVPTTIGELPPHEKSKTIK